MKAALFTLSLLLPLSSFAAFNPKSALECKAEDGTRILLNDEFAGPGKALVTGRAGLYTVSMYATSSVLSIGLSSGSRVMASELKLALDLAHQEITERKEGNQIVQYVYVPASLETTNLWSGNSQVSAKCIQSL